MMVKPVPLTLQEYPRGVYGCTCQSRAASLFRDYEGARYYFCCAACGPRFDADPAKYVAAA